METIIFRFHVKFRGSIHPLPEKNMQVDRPRHIFVAVRDGSRTLATLKGWQTKKKLPKSTKTPPDVYRMDGTSFHLPNIMVGILL